jgi:nickel/cobalt transporter (NiCoT) family protein
VISSRLHAVRTALTVREWGRLAAMFGFILAVNVLGWAIFVLYVMPHHFDYRGEGGSLGLGVGIGVAITAWFLGFRHAFDVEARWSSQVTTGPAQPSRPVPESR